MDGIILVNEFFKGLANLDFSEVKAFIPGLYLVSLAFLSIALILKRNRCYGSFLKDLGENEKSPSIQRTTYGYKVSGLPDKYFSQVFWKNHLEQVSASLNAKLVGFELVIKKKPQILLFEDKLPEIVRKSEFPYNCNPFEVILGVSDRGEVVKHSFIDLPSMYIDGRPGSGKSVALKGIIDGILESITGSNFKCLILTTKTHDFREFRGGFQIIDPFEEGSTQLIDSFFKEIESDINELRDRLLDNPGFEFSNLELSRKILGDQIPRRLIVMDEARDYLFREKADPKDIAQIKQHLNNLTYTHLRRNSRFMTIPLIVASQVQGEGELGLPIKSFHSRLASFTNEAMSRIICGDNRLSSLNQNPGKFYYSNLNRFLRVALNDL